MVRSLWTAATGMNGQQANIDAISNNLSNVNTTGFKQQRVEFEDLIYQNLKLAGWNSAGNWCKTCRYSKNYDSGFFAEYWS